MAEERRNPNRPMSAEETKRYMKVNAVLTVSALIFMIGFILLVCIDIVILYPKNMQAEALKGFAARVEFTLRYQTLLIFWLMFNVLATIYARVRSHSLNPLEERTEQKIIPIKNVLTNSFESIIISVFSQLIFISFAEPATILRFIPLINVIQFIGRIAFFAGYPLKRSFGYACTFVPNIFLAAYNLYRLGSFWGFY